MNIDGLEDVRLVTLHPLTDAPESTHPDDAEALIASYGVLRLLGVVGTAKSVCLTLRGPIVNESVRIGVVEESLFALSPALRHSLRIEYEALKSFAAAAIPPTC